jgi:transposase
MAHVRKSRPHVESFPVLNPHVAGIDVHAASHWVAVDPSVVPAEAPASDHPPEVRTFGTCTADLAQLADWLTACGVTSVAMESSGNYWTVLFAFLETRGFTVIVVDGRQTRQVTGRPKSDRLDCQWIRRLHSCGLLAASFRPAEDVLALRGFIRQRLSLIADAGEHIPHMQKAPEEMNVKLTEVLADLSGVTGPAIIRSIIGGERDAANLSHLRDPGCRKTEAEFVRALQGSWRDEHLFCLKPAFELYERHQRLIAECDQRIEACLKSFDDRSAGAPLPAVKRFSSKSGRQPNDLTFNARPLLHRMMGQDLTVIEGISERTAIVLAAEIGPDVSKFPTEKHFTSWLGLCPQHRGSGGKIKSRRVRRGASRAARALRLAARGCHHAQHALGAFYRRVQMRCGGPRAVVATARKIAERVYRLLKYGGAYERRSAEEYEEAYRARVLRGMRRRAAELGYRLERIEEKAEMSISP